MVRMRTNRDNGAVCCECGNGQTRSLEMFDIMLAGHVFTLCDNCNEKLLQKTLRADCNVKCKVKKPHDMEIIRKRQKGCE